MSHRLVGRLQAAAKQQQAADENEQLEPHAQISRELALAVLKNDLEKGWNLLEQPSRLRIRTIDSLCSELARQLPVLSGLGGGQQIAIDANALYRKAAARTMAVIEDDNDDLQTDVTRVLDRYDNQYDRLVELLTSMLASREQWMGHLLDSRTADGFDRQGMEEALRYLVGIQLETARQITPDHLLTELPRFYNFALSNSPADEAALKELLEASGGLDGDFLDLQVSADALPHWKTMIDRCLTADGKKWRTAADAKAGFPAPSSAKGEEKERLKAWKDDFKALLDEYRENDALRDIYNTINTLPSPDYEDEAWESLESLMRILLRAALEWDLVMAETGELDFAEVAHRAIRSLGFEDAPSDLALRMDYRIQHLLVDEFQDTSASQIRLLDKLTTGWSDGDGRTLFLVGDPMQSIYRFRKAEVSLFIKAWQAQLFEHIQLEPLQLSVNFRSTRPIVAWVNQTFPMVMPRKNDAVMGAVSYSEASTQPGVSDHGDVAIHLLPGRDDNEEARLVTELIAACDPDETVAILVRSRSHASAILAALDRLKADHPRYRYQAIKFTRLTDTTLIQDLVSLTLALIQPADRLAWLATLRAPYIGLDLADLDELVAGNSENIILDAISFAAGIVPGGEETIAKSGPGTLSANGRQRLHRTGPVLLRAVNRRGRQSVRSLVEATWILLGGPACVENASELDDATTYFDLLELLEGESLPIDRDTLELRLKDLYAEPDAGANGNLQVITIYAAKGLQFDTVILPGLNRSPRGDDNQLLHWFELPGEDRMVMSPMRNHAEKQQQKKSGDLIQFISNVENQRQGLEDGRLLYVAATRAKRRLYLFAAIKPNANGDIKPNANSLLGGLWPAIRDAQTPLIHQSAECLQLTEEQPADEEMEPQTATLEFPQIYRRLAAGWQLPDPPESVPQPNIEQVETHNTIEFSWAGEDARLTGNLVHRLLQLIGEQGLGNWQASGGMVKHVNWCRQQLASEGVQKEKADAIISRAAQAIANCLASEQARWILASHADARCEYALTAVLDKQPRSLVLDRTFVENGTRWIIDYKTSSHSGGDLEGFLANETERYREQLQRYKDALAITETRPIKTALYFPMLDRFLEVG
jgi:ATP-dependent exoDNAse (exonuclease V) beta subunit